MLKKPKKKTVSQLKRKADAIFSLYIRKKYSDLHTGLAGCVTCPVIDNWKNLQCGHYETRGSNILRYDERNAHVQCVGCNIFKKGNYPRYVLFMVKTYGPAILEELAEESKITKQFKVFELEEIIEHYRAKIEALTVVETPVN